MEKKDGALFETEEVEQLGNELKIVRHKIFSLKSKERKIAWREKDKQSREKRSAKQTERCEEIIKL